MSDSGAYLLLDIKHGLALFFGTREEMESRKESICSRCRSYGAEHDATPFLLVLSKQEVGETEYEYMVVKRRMPRRLVMRLQPKEAEL